jgi:glucan phosphoethanolaminetransferase (alkaline phosphatase superfamily)
MRESFAGSVKLNSILALLLMFIVIAASELSKAYGYLHWSWWLLMGMAQVLGIILIKRRWPTLQRSHKILFLACLATTLLIAVVAFYK